MLVLDEADKAFDRAPDHEIRRLLGLLSQCRQNILFSANFPNQVKTATRWLRLNDTVSGTDRRSRPSIGGTN